MGTRGTSLSQKASQQAGFSGKMISPCCWRLLCLDAMRQAEAKSECTNFIISLMQARGQASYLRTIDEHGDVSSSLVMSKAKVTPKRAVTIPRLELTAAVLSVSISCFLEKELDIPDLKHYYRTDSKVVLGYISNESRRFHIFVEPCPAHSPAYLPEAVELRVLERESGRSGLTWPHRRRTAAQHSVVAWSAVSDEFRGPPGSCRVHRSVRPRPRSEEEQSSINDMPTRA